MTFKEWWGSQDTNVLVALHRIWDSGKAEGVAAERKRILGLLEKLPGYPETVTFSDLIRAIEHPEPETEKQDAT